ncbi:MAG: T9SS type A sorting domain-containing protein, partial [Bacteroidota bacterium]|nr:T9SS type A sorting domain-containing protein [Bacteroidota bacterium]
QMNSAALPIKESDTFSISKAISLQVGFNCPDSFLLFWEALPVVGQYQLYRLGDKYLEPLYTASDTFVMINKNQSASLYYSVAPIIQGKPGLRSHTLNYTLQGVACYFKTFYLQSQNRDEAVFTAMLGTTFNVSDIAFQKLHNNQFINLKTISKPTATSFAFTDSSLTQGVNKYRLQIRLNNGTALYSHEIRTYHFADASTIIYPNPARQEEPVNIITNGASETRIEVLSANGAFILSMPLTSTLTQIQPNLLSKGIYFIRIINDEGKVSTQKLVVY